MPSHDEGQPCPQCQMLTPLRTMIHTPGEIVRRYRCPRCGHDWAYEMTASKDSAGAADTATSPDAAGDTPPVVPLQR